MSEPGREKAGGRVVVLTVVGLLLLLGGGYVAAYVAAGDKVPRGTTVAGVDIGGRTDVAAVQALEAGLSERADAPIAVTVDGERADVDPAKAGLSVDYAASVEAAGGGRSWDPQRLWHYYTDGEDLDAVVEVDEAAMARTVDELVADAGAPARDGDVEFTATGVKVVQPRTGEAVDPDAAADALAAAYLEKGATAELELVPTRPDVDDSDVQEALDGFANPAMSGPVTLLFDDAPVRLTPRQFGPVLGMRAREGELVPDLDEKALGRLVDSATSRDGAPVDASFRIVAGKPQIVPDRPGVTYEPDDVADTFLDLVVRPEGKREQKVRSTVARADFTTADARKLGIKERVSTFTTYYPHADYRNTNIGRAAELVNGTVLEPDEEFSLNGIVGERTRENGFTDGFVINDGILVEDLGGGVSQMATTTFNAMFFAGLEDVEHKPHSFYIDRYPVGREATVAWGAVDLRFRNDTPYGVLVTANVTPSTPATQGVVTVSMWSTEYWDVETSTSDRYAFTEPATRTLSTPDCYPNEGYGGFDVDVFRTVSRDGEVVKDETFHTTYIPSDTVICKPPND